ncbi:MutS2 family protein [Plesiocystis pacifica SIR-1]|uniref:MutS2 family protein n=1 Tax=Plesiocystis pacifica SIR-1 TaxID=391625 RepID=A6G6E8_9BACT|nr:Smr/MutS family protein [Plesiocystis pacifica]EDM78577.1 MutS2 family protein [Plesiocystis pacifica SIR-1]
MASGQGPRDLASHLAEGRGDALRHLGWPRLQRFLAAELHVDAVRQRVFDEIEAMQLSLAANAEREDEDEERSAGVIAALARRPSIFPEANERAASRRHDELDGLDVVWRFDEGDSQEPEDVASSSGVDEALGTRGGVRGALRELEDLDESLAIARTGAALTVVELIGVTQLCLAVARICAAVEEATEVAAGEGLNARQRRGLEALRALLNLRDTRAPASDDEPGEVSDASEPSDGEQRGRVGVAPLPELAGLLDRAIERRPKSGDGEPRISGKASPALAEARKQVRACKQRLLAKAERALRDPHFAECLRDGYWTERDGRVVFPVRSDALGKIRRSGAIIHGSSGSGHTFFVEPAPLVEDNNALREAELDAAEEERRVLRELSAKVAEHADALAAMQASCFALDLVAARLALSQRFDGVRPELGDAVELRAARHPLMLFDGVEVVPNDLVIARGEGLIISGPNAGGKTVALKTLGLCALMAAAGLRVPCRGRARVPVFRAIVTDVGDDQSIIANLSTFSAHIRHVQEALRQARADGRGTLVLLDEVAVGTDPEQGAALAESILTELVDAEATLVVTTHYDRLKLLASQDPRFHNAAVGFDLQRMRPTFRLSLGVPGSSSAIAVARRLGVPEVVLRRAEDLLGDEGRRVDELLRDIEAERAALARTRQRVERDLLRLKQRDREVRVRERRVLEGVRSRKAVAYAAAADELRDLERELKRRRKALRRAAPERVEELPTRGELSSDARAELARHRAADEAEAESDRRAEDHVDARELAVGDKVRVRSMKQVGEIVALSGNPPRKVTVQLPLMRTTVKPKDLAPVVELPKRKLKIRASAPAPVFDFRASVSAQAARHFGDDAQPVKTSVDNVFDVRGERFEDARERVADYVAEALARDQDVILIRHGHGGGALRKAVRERLREHPNVKKVRAGLVQEGSNAVTVAWLE